MFDPDTPGEAPGLFGFYLGTVVDRSDGEGLGRVRVTIPGLAEESGWAWPLGVPGGGMAQSGLWWVPELGTTVAVFFAHGDVDAPWYMPAHWGRGEAPTGADVDLKVLETVEFRLEVDDGAKTLKIAAKGAGAVLTLDADGVELADEGATEAVIKGTAFKVHYLAHTHAAVGGTTGPPLNAATFDVPPGTHLSTKTKTG